MPKENFILSRLSKYFYLDMSFKKTAFSINQRRATDHTKEAFVVRSSFLKAARKILFPSRGKNIFLLQRKRWKKNHKMWAEKKIFLEQALNCPNQINVLCPAEMH